MASATAKKPRSHPPYAEMISEAITGLKERTGSSQVAIAKFIEENQKDLPSNFRKLLLIQLKKLVASGKLTKVKNSFKLAVAVKPTVAPTKVPAKKEAAAKKVTKAVVKKAKVATPAKKVAVSKVKKTPVKKVAVSKVKKTPVKKVAPVKKIVKKPKSIKSPAKKQKK